MSPSPNTPGAGTPGTLPAAGRLLRAALVLSVALGLALPPRLWAMGPFERNPPKVEEGLHAYEAGKYEEALAAFEEAKKQLPPSAALEFDRANALFKLGRLDEAKQAYHHVAEMDRSALRAKDLYNLGNAWASLGDDKEAISAFRRALTLDPKDDQARHNLEVMLRRIPPPPPPAPDGGTDGGADAGSDGGRPDGGMRRDGGTDAGMDGGAPDGGADGGSDAGSPGDGGSDGGSDGGADGGSGRGDQRGDAGQPNDDEQGAQDGGTGEGFDGGVEEAESIGLDGGSADLSKKDAERLLDSMRQTEKNLQLWRFQQRKKNRRPNEKDW